MSICGIVAAAGPKGELIACNLPSGHDGGHSWEEREEEYIEEEYDLPPLPPLPTRKPVEKVGPPPEPITFPASCLFTDGGVIGANPSTTGGTWAWVRVENSKEVDRGVGLLLPETLGVQTVSNNNTELLALLRGIECLPDNWNGMVYSDSGIALGWVFRQFRLDSVPDYLRGLLSGTLIGAKERGVVMDCRLLAGHPTKADLEAGYRVKKAPHYPVSPFNVLCDDLCTRRAATRMRWVCLGAGAELIRVRRK